MKYPANHGKPLPYVLKKIIRHEYANGASIHALAAKYGRTTVSIKYVVGIIGGARRVHVIKKPTLPINFRIKQSRTES